MGINLNNRIIADTRLASVHGGRIAGGYLLRISVAFNVSAWDGASPPVVVLGPARVYVNGTGGMLLGTALAEVPQPFRVYAHNHQSAVIFELPMPPGAMEALERLRNGQGISLTLKLQSEVRTAAELHVSQDDVQGTFNVADWATVLDQTGYGTTMLFEVPLPSDLPGLKVVAERLEAARRQLAQGHYGEVVAACRVALEELTDALGQQPAMKVARDQHKKDRTALDLVQRELMMRQALSDFTHLAHHSTGISFAELFDRNAAQLTLGSTAALVSSALARHAASQRVV